MIAMIDGHKIITDSDMKYYPRPNLLDGTSDFKGFTNAPSTDQLDTNGNKISTGTTWSAPMTQVQVSTGQVLTFSAIVQAKSDNLPRLGIFGGDDKNGGTATMQDISGNINVRIYYDGNKCAMKDVDSTFPVPDKNPHIISGTIKVTKGGILVPRAEESSSNGFYVSSYKLEHGSFATPWCPSIKDISSLLGR